MPKGKCIVSTHKVILKDWEDIALSPYLAALSRILRGLLANNFSSHVPSQVMHVQHFDRDVSLLNNIYGPHKTPFGEETSSYIRTQTTTI